MNPHIADAQIILKKLASDAGFCAFARSILKLLP